MPLVLSWLLGSVFGIGLIVAGMTNPAKVQAFLDLGGAWDPSLALVMGSAIAVAMPLFRWSRGWSRSLLGGPMPLPPASRIDRRLVLGSLLFGAGWGLAGFCPGPALVALGMGYGKAAIFCAAMLAGMWLFQQMEARQARRRRP